MSESAQFPPRDCPACKATGITLAGECALCKGKKLVSHFVAAAWYIENGDSDPPPPPAVT